MGFTPGNPLHNVNQQIEAERRRVQQAEAARKDQWMREEADRQRESRRQGLFEGAGYHTHPTNGKYLGKTETDSVGRLWHIDVDGKYLGKTER
jgi:hypothetical protein